MRFIQIPFTGPVVLTIALLATIPSFSQSSISGKVQDNQGKALPFANVLLLSPKDSSLVKGMVCNETGYYRLDKLSPGEYLMLASMMGYKKAYSSLFTIRQGSEDLPISTLMLAEDVQQLGEVVVEAQKQLYEQQIDKLVVNVQSSITAAGSTALDVLERSPGVTVNRQNRGLALVGKQGVIIMINGKQSRMPMEAIIQMLGGMNASNIEKIELITTPSASYDAEGNAGIINIMLKKDSEFGTNGSYSLSMGWGWYEKPSASANINHRTQRLNLFADYSFSLDHAMQRFEFYRNLRDQGQISTLGTVSRRNTRQYMHNARIGADYTLGPKSTVGGLLAGFDSRWEMLARNTTSIEEPQQPTAYVWMNDDELNHWKHWMANLNFRHTFSAGNLFSLDLDYLYYHDNNPHHYTNSFENLEEQNIADEIRIDKRTPIRVGVLKADYTHNLGEKTKLEAGVKGTLTSLQNDVLVENKLQAGWSEDAEFTQHVEMREDISAAYFNLKQQFEGKFSLQAGLRWEYTYTHLSSPEEENLVLRRYGKLFPSIFVTKGLGEHSNLQFSYSKRITRPTYSDLAPFVVFFDPYTFFSGNTNLKPALTDAVQLGYQFKGSYMLSLQYSHQKDAIARYQSHVDPETNKQYGYTENIDNTNTLSISLSLPIDVTPWWNIQTNLMGVSQQIETVYDNVPIAMDNQYGTISGSMNFKLPHGFGAELSGFYRSRSLFGIAELHPLGALNAGVQKKFKNEKGTLRFSINDIFWTQRIRIETINPELNLDGHAALIFEPRVVRLTYSRNFGNKNVKSAKRTTGSEEERNRVGN
jgi:hypothetical protein